MGSALARAAAKSERTEKLLLSNRTAEKALRLARELGGEQRDNRDVAEQAQFLFFAVKPQMLEGMLSGIRDVLQARQDRFVIVSMVAGKDLATLQTLLGTGTPIIRIMPNMPVIVGSGLSQYVFNEEVNEEEKDFFLKLMAPSGVLMQNEEHYMASVGGVTGCGPAFAAMFIEALADGAVVCGVSRKDAYVYAAEMMKGTADLYLKSGQHPGAIKDSVCSPAGLTIEGVRVLEEKGFRSALIEALIATYVKRF
jgi:pyrroline-5-carboxylate reductase